MTHGGARKGAGRPLANFDEKRVVALRKQGLTTHEIGQLLGVHASTIARRCRRLGL